MSWFLIQSWLFILVAFLLGLLVAYLWWHRRLRKVGVSESRVAQSLTAAHGTELTERDKLLDELRRSNDGLRTERDRAVADLQNNSSKAAALVGATETLQADLDTARAEHSTCAAEASDLRTRLAKAESALAAAQGGAPAPAAPSAQASRIRGLVGSPIADVTDATGAATPAAAIPTEAATAATAAAASIQGLVGDTADTADGADDLERIEGIGPRFGAALRDAGIRRFAALAASSEDDLKRAIEAAGLSFAPSLSSWPQQAGYLANGDEAGFQALTDRLIAGRDTGGAR